MDGPLRVGKFFHYVADSCSWMLDEGATSGNSFVRMIETIDRIIGFDPLDDRTEYLAGIDHWAFQNRAEKWGESMRDAFQPFERGLRYKHANNVRLWRGYADTNLDENAVTFGSPNSSVLARHIYGVDVDEHDRFVTRSDAGSTIQFENPSNDKIIRKAGYLETHRGLRMPDGKTFVPQHKDGLLLDDYLLISCVGHPPSRQVNARRLDGQIADMEARAADGALDLAEYKDLEVLKEMRSKVRVSRILCVSGLYGPGTGAANILFSEARRLDELKAATAGMGTFHAIYHIPEISTKWGREIPIALSAKPVAILPAD